MRKPKHQLAKFEELWQEQMRPLTAESLLHQINFVEADLDRLCAYVYSAENEDGDLIFKLKSFVRRTLRNVARFTVARGKLEIGDVFDNSSSRMYKAGQVVSIFDAVGCEDPNTNLPRRTYCVFQMCHDKRTVEHDGKTTNIVSYGRLVDKITTSVQVGINMYKRIYHGDVLFVPDHNDKEDMPENLLYLDDDKLTLQDIEWLRANQDCCGMPIPEYIQQLADDGSLGIPHYGIVYKIFNNEVYAHKFIIELRHIY
jgi:hypothetical protein